MLDQVNQLAFIPSHNPEAHELHSELGSLLCLKWLVSQLLFNLGRKSSSILKINFGHIPKGSLGQHKLLLVAQGNKAQSHQPRTCWVSVRTFANPVAQLMAEGKPPLS